MGSLKIFEAFSDSMMEQSRKMLWLREWIIFALSIGLGGHVALGLILHDPASELWGNIGWNAFFIGLFI